MRSLSLPFETSCSLFWQKSREKGLEWTGMIISAPALKADPKAAGPVILSLLSYLSWALPKFQVCNTPPLPQVRKAARKSHSAA